MIPTRSASSAGSASTASRNASTSPASSFPHAPPDDAAVPGAIAGGAAGVALHDRVPGGHVGLRLVEQVPAVLGERAAVDREQDRVRPRAGRHRDPAVYRVA